MSITVPPEWIAVFADGSTFSSAQGLWSEFSDLTKIGNVDLSLSRHPIREVTIMHDGKHYTFLPDEPCPCFAFHRWRSLSGQQSAWLYSAFGCVRDRLRIVLSIGPRGVQTRIEDAATFFVL